jgi:hypothetical protein
VTARQRKTRPVTPVVDQVVEDRYVKIRQGAADLSELMAGRNLPVPGVAVVRVLVSHDGMFAGSIQEIPWSLRVGNLVDAGYLDPILLPEDHVWYEVPGGTNDQDHPEGHQDHS